MTEESEILKRLNSDIFEARHELQTVLNNTHTAQIKLDILRSRLQRALKYLNESAPLI